MDTVLNQLQRDLNKIQQKKHISRQDNYSQCFFNASPVVKVNYTQAESSRDHQLNSSSQSIVFSSPQTFRERDRNNYQMNKIQASIVSNDKNLQKPSHRKLQSSSHRSETSSQLNITPKQYNTIKEEIKDVFISKDDLFKMINRQFKKLLQNRQTYIHNFKQNNANVLNYWMNQTQELQELINEIKESQQQYQSLIQTYKSNLSEQQSQTNLSLSKSKSQERRIWLSKNPKIGKKSSMGLPIFSIREESNKSNFSTVSLQQQQNQDNSDSDCNVDEDEICIEKQVKSVHQVQLLKDQKFQETSIQIATQNYNQINNYLTILIQISNQIKHMCAQQYQDKKQTDDEILFNELCEIHESVKVIEERYFGTTMAWEKELRDLINKNKIKSQKILELDKTIQDINLKKNEIQFKYETLEREIELINKSLQIQYGMSHFNYNTNDHSNTTTRLDLENIKKVFAENERLKQDFEKLFDNIESSRTDLQRLSSVNKNTNSSVPKIAALQQRQLKEQYDQQLQQLTSQYDQKYQTLNNEIQKSRQKVIDIIDEKQLMEKDIYQLKLEKKDLKNDLEMKTKRIQELEIQLQESKYKSSHIFMQAESKSIAVNEVHTRNEILNESLDKLKTELLNQKRMYSQLENEHFDLEKENLRIKTDNKKLSVQNQSYQDEKEHLIQMLEMKNHLLATDNSTFNDYPKIVGGTPVTQLDQFLAIQRLSMFVLNRNGQHGDTIDENTKSIVRSIFNENVCKLIDQYENKITQQKKIIKDLQQELNDNQQQTIQCIQQNLHYIEILLEFTQEFQKMQLNDMPQQVLMINEKIMSINPQLQNDKQQLKRQNEQQNMKMKQLFTQMEQMKHDHRQEFDKSQLKLNVQQQTELKDRSLLIAQQSPQKLKEQLINENQAKLQAKIEELKQQNENQQYKIDQLIEDNEELNRQINNLKKKEQDNHKLKAQVEQMKELISKLQQKNQLQIQQTSSQLTDNQVDKDQQNFSDLKLVIQKLDNELKREKSQVESLRQQLNDQSLFDGLDGFIEDDQIFNKSSDTRTTGRMGAMNAANGDYTGMKIRRNQKNKSSDVINNVFDDSSPVQSPFVNHNKGYKKTSTKRENMKMQYENQVNQLKKNIEDNKQMIELQCIVIEDLLEQRNKLQSDLSQEQKKQSRLQSPDIKLLKANNKPELNSPYTNKSPSGSPERVSSINRGESKIPRLSISRQNK